MTATGVAVTPPPISSVAAGGALTSAVGGAAAVAVGSPAVDVVAVFAAAVLGAAAAAMSGPVADRLARTRYAIGAPGHDPDDAALAPLRAPTSARARVAVTVLGAAAGAALTAAVGWGVVLAPFAVVAWIGLTGALVDLQYLRLPNVLTYGGAAAALALCGVGALWYDAGPSFRGAVTGSLAYGGFLLLMLVLFRVLVRRDGLGLGDVKLALALGAPLGWYAWSPQFGVVDPLRLVVYAAMFGSFASLLVAPALTRLERGRSFPYGPFMVAGWMVAAVFADPLLG